jgi:hypothetical protein
VQYSSPLPTYFTNSYVDLSPQYYKHTPDAEDEGELGRESYYSSSAIDDSSEDLTNFHGPLECYSSSYNTFSSSTPSFDDPMPTYDITALNLHGIGQWVDECHPSFHDELAWERAAELEEMLEIDIDSRLVKPQVRKALYCFQTSFCRCEGLSYEGRQYN